VIFEPGGRIEILPIMRDADLRPPGEGRPPGLHLSQLIQRICGFGQEGIVTEDAAVRVQMGFIWEAAVELTLAGAPWASALEMAARRYWVSMRTPPAKQVRLLVDGIHMTPDGYREADRTLEEYKLTWKSLRKAESAEKFAEHFRHWIIQAASYCYGLGQMYDQRICKVEWIVGWMGGDYSYKPGGGPQWSSIRAELTPEEVRATWGLVMGAKREWEMANGQEQQEQQGK